MISIAFRNFKVTILVILTLLAKCKNPNMLYYDSFSISEIQCERINKLFRRQLSIPLIGWL